MNFRDIALDVEYTSYESDTLNDFYIPVLERSKSVMRAVGYFRSDFLYEVSKGLYQFIKNEGYMRIITSTDLTIEDLSLIQEGYDLKKILSEKLCEIVFDESIPDYQERYNYVASLIANGNLDIKVATKVSNKSRGLFHEKWGVFTDHVGNRLSINGSNNDTFSALKLNGESFEVNFSWEALTDSKKIAKKENRFEKLWNNEIEGVIVSDLPSNIVEKITSYKMEYLVPEDQLVKNVIEDEILKKSKENNIAVPSFYTIRDYQESAFQKWEENGYKGILSMATGTGKTVTALYSLTRLIKKANPLFIVIVCPYIHLVDQWVEDLEEFGYKSIVGHTYSKNKKWKNELVRNIRMLNEHDKEYVCFITTNQSYSSSFIQSTISKSTTEKILIVDEVHNFSTPNNLELLKAEYDYRLGLSATVENKYNSDLSDELKNIFSGIVFEISIEEAIYDYKCLVEYDYYPIICFMSHYEFNEYKRLSEIVNENCYEKDNRFHLKKKGKIAAYSRSKLLALLVSKYDTFRNEYLDKFRVQGNNLVYCGAANYYENGEADELENRQVDEISELLMTNDILACKFTAKEDLEARKKIKSAFMDGDLNTIVAIKCLDEGTNIPCIERAYILASSKNEKQYIQRRGRVLRKFSYDGYEKEFAEIYDFVALPFIVDNNIDDTDFQFGKQLASSELTRIYDFYKTCRNKSYVGEIINEIIESYEVEVEYEIE